MKGKPISNLNKIHPTTCPTLAQVREQYKDRRFYYDYEYICYMLPDGQKELEHRLVARAAYGVAARKAKKSTAQRPRPGFVYLLKSQDVYKIGRSVDPQRRIGQISPIMPHGIELIHAIEAEDMIALEADLHAQFADKRLNGEWFDLSPEDVATFMEVAL